MRGEVDDDSGEGSADIAPIYVSVDSEIDDSLLDFLKDIIEGLKVIHENGYHHGNVRF